MAMNSPRGRGRPSKAVVTRTAIAQAGLSIASTRGYEALTMAALARHLGVAPSALYNHVRNKADLLIVIQDEVMTSVDTSPLDAAIAGTLSPKKALAAWARSYRDVFSQHLPLVQIIATFPIIGAPETVKIYNKAAHVLQLTALEPHLILPRLIALESFIYGSAFDVHAPENIFDTTGMTPDPTFLHDAVVKFHNSICPPDQTDSQNIYAETPFTVGLNALLADF
ncbi:TetR/AcrR family transcriptional regulator [Corynebacterium ulcerans]|uniref:TetR/AcrR family transcriptional regulator n=1 Tax=Corynebacterium ulcerans TaxID=65058 RepID=UPI00031B1AE6|nr:TetR/AcrR family transcriptional regulator [Corynebacterium ulcerans]